MKRATRLIRLTQLLRDRAYTVEELAQKCEVSERTIRRDLCDLANDLDVPLIVERIWKIVQGWTGFVHS